MSIDDAPTPLVLSKIFVGAQHAAPLLGTIVRVILALSFLVVTDNSRLPVVVRGSRRANRRSIRRLSRRRKLQPLRVFLE
jgi:hypothetical protein